MTVVVSVVLCSVLAARPAAAESGSHVLLVVPEVVQTQARTGSIIADVVRVEIATERFNTYVNQYALGPVTWVADGVALFSKNADGQKINVAVVNLATSRGVQVSPPNRRDVVGSFAGGIGATVAINGNWYQPWDGPAVSNGHVYGGRDHGYTSLFGVTADNKVIVEHHTVERDTVDPRIVNGVSGHPTLIHNGAPQVINPDPTFMVRHPRTIIGESGPTGILLMVTVDGRQPDAAGMTGDEARDLMASLGAHQAVMLDGGGSTTMWVAGRGIVNSPSEAPRSVANEIAAFGA